MTRPPRKKIRYTPEEVWRLLEGDEVHLIDVRDEADYEALHLPGAVNLPEVFRFLAESTPEGRAVMESTFAAAFSRAGVTPERPTVFYEDSLDSRFGSSCRGRWLLTWLGHPRAGILDGGLAGWLARGLRAEEGRVEPVPSRFVPGPRDEMLATLEDVRQALEDPAVVLLDNRDRPEWLGVRGSPYEKDSTPRRGRIPGARWLEWYAFLDRSLPIPTFRDAGTIREICRRRGLSPRDRIILYCFKGSRSANTHVALTEAGFSKVRLYFASWNEWSHRPELPVEEGAPGRDL